MTGKKDVLSYLDNLPLEEKEALQSLRNQILDITPNFEERLSRGVPFFYYQGKRAVGFRSSKKHLSFFIMEGNVLNTLRNEFNAFKNGPTVIQFTPENPLPKELISKLVRARISEIEKSVSKK